MNIKKSPKKNTKVNFEKSKSNSPEEYIKKLEKIYNRNTPFLNVFNGNVNKSLITEEYIGNYFSLPDIISEITKFNNVTNLKVSEPLVFAYEVLLKIIEHSINHICKIVNNEQIDSLEENYEKITQSILRMGIGSLNIIFPNYISSYNIKSILQFLAVELFLGGKSKDNKTLILPRYEDYLNISSDILLSNIFIPGLIYDPIKKDQKINEKNTLIIPDYFNPVAGFIGNRINTFTYLNEQFINDQKFSQDYLGSFNINIYTGFLTSNDFVNFLESNISNFITKSIYFNYFKQESHIKSFITDSSNNITNLASSILQDNYEKTIYNGMIHIFCNNTGVQLPSSITKFCNNAEFSPNLNIFRSFVENQLEDISIFKPDLSKIILDDKKEFEFQNTKLKDQDKNLLINKCLEYLEITKNINLHESYKFIVSTIYDYSKNITEPFEDFAKNLNIIKDYQDSISKRSLSLVHIPLTYDQKDLGGFDIFKTKVQEYKNHLEILESHPDYPTRGGAILLGGVPGAGKTLSAMWAASYLGRTLYQMNISKLIGSLQGVSEKNMENDLNTIKSMGKIVLLVDEIEKVFGGVASSHQTDGGVLLRLLEKFMAFLSEENPDIFIIMTCNSLVGLPTALLRSGRISNLMFCDFPSTEELENIFDIQEKKELMGRLKITKDEKSNFIELLKNRTNYNGSDIRELFRQAFNYSIGLDNSDPTIEHLIKAFMVYKPNAEKLAEGIEHIRNTFLESFEPASSKSEAFNLYKQKFIQNMSDVNSKLSPKLKKIFNDQIESIFNIDKKSNNIIDLDI